MTIDAFLQAVAAIKAENPRYHAGRVGDDGFCDCIGLIIGAVERSGGTWTGIHGSNWWARHYTSALMRVTDANDLSLGDLVYKTRAPGATGYTLPSRYAGDPDRLDYYHVGVVTAVNPLEITHCTSGGGVDGITTDTRLGNWTYKGQLTLIRHIDTEEAVVLTQATVHASNGKDVNMRHKPDKSGALVDRLPVGTEVTLVSHADGWGKIVTDKGVTGYMMMEFLRVNAGNDSPEMTLEALMARLAALENRVDELEGGQG